VFFEAAARRKWLVLACLIGAGLAEGIGIASLLPLVAVMGDQSAATDSPLGQFFTDALNAVGLANSIGVLLIIICIATVLKASLSILALRFVGYAVTDVTTGFRVKALRGLLECDWSYFGKRPLGILSGLVGGAANQAGKAFQMAAMMIANLVQCGIYVAGAMLVSIELGF